MRFARNCLLLLLFVMPAHADENVDALLAKAESLGLATDPQWLALLHVNRGGTTRDRGRSYVDDPQFFLAPGGDGNAAAELAATVRALFVAEGDGRARCRFVARHRWLAARLGQPAPDARADCAEYAAWRAPLNAGRVTLVFPGSYLNSPSSMFGHTLLRLDPPAGEGGTVWLSQAVSFGADVQGADNSALYIWKGLAGGYPGRFLVEPYFAKIQQYGRMENRDLWEYPLDLTADEASFLVDHLWELQAVNFDYYFFDENCSYRLLELLEVARPALALTRRWRLSEVPVNTIRSVRAAPLAGTPLLRPSAERELRARLDGLAGDEQDVLYALLEEPALPATPALSALPVERQAAVLRTAHAQLVYRARKQSGRDPVRATQSLELLRALNALGINPPVDVPAPSAPEEGHRTRRLTLGGGALAGGDLAGDSRDGFSVVGFRPSYHDMLDPVDGYLPGAELEIFDTELRADEDGDLRLERLDVANIFSLTPRDRFFRSWSWRVRVGVERQPVPDFVNDSVRHAEGGGGIAWQVGDVFARAYVEARIEHNGAYDHLVDIGAGPAIGIVGQHARINWSLDARPMHFSGGFARTEARAAAQWQPAKDWGLRAEIRWRLADAGVADTETVDAQLVLHRYF